jgi:uncharacterized Fe-S cluster-containing radical SAM superfamily protein
MRIDPIKRALELRKTIILDDKVLVVDFTNTLEGKDTSIVLDLMPIVGKKIYPFRTKANVKELDEFACKVYGGEFFNIKEKSKKEIESFIKNKEFDFPLWYKNDKGFDIKEVTHYNWPFIMQFGACNFHDSTETGGCWYCFVDNKSNNGIPNAEKVYLGVDETLDSIIDAKKNIKELYKKIDQDMDFKVVRTSGGEPTIALDWILRLWRNIEKRNLHVFGQIDSNLSTAMVVDKFENEGIYEKNILKKLAQYPIKVLTALKGCDEQNLQSNVQSTARLEEQKYSILKFIMAGFEIFPQMYNPNPETLEGYLKEMDNLIENFSLRIHIGPLKIYSPTKQRLTLEAKRLGKNPEEFISENKRAWDENYEKSSDVINDYLIKKYNVGYKELIRSDVKLKIK